MKRRVSFSVPYLSLYFFINSCQPVCSSVCFQMLNFFFSRSPSRAPEPRSGGGEEGRPVAVGRSGHHVGGWAAV